MSEEHYPPRMIAMLEAVWGGGFLPPGGVGEVARMKGEVGDRAAAIVGRDFVDQNIAIWERMIPVLDSGEHCPTHLAGRKP